MDIVSICFLSAMLLVVSLVVYWNYVVWPGRVEKMRLQWLAVSNKLDLIKDKAQ